MLLRRKNQTLQTQMLSKFILNCSIRRERTIAASDTEVGNAEHFCPFPQMCKVPLSRQARQHLYSNPVSDLFRGAIKMVLRLSWTDPFPRAQLGSAAIYRTPVIALTANRLSSVEPHGVFCVPRHERTSQPLSADHIACGFWHVVLLKNFRKQLPDFTSRLL